MSPQNRYVLIGAIAGAGLGALAAFAYYRQQTTGLTTTKRIEGKTVQVEAGVGDFAKLGLAMFGILREVQSMLKVK